jgi:hypothetical protein
VIRTLSIGFGDRVRSQANIPVEYGVGFRVSGISGKDRNARSSESKGISVGSCIGVVGVSGDDWLPEAGKVWVDFAGLRCCVFCGIHIAEGCGGSSDVDFLRIHDMEMDHGESFNIRYRWRIDLLAYLLEAMGSGR